MPAPRASTPTLSPTPSLLVEPRHLTPTEAGLVIDEIRRSATITGYDFDEWTRSREIVVASDPETGELVGVALA